MFKTHRTFNLTPGMKNNSIAVFHAAPILGVLYHQTQVVTAKESKDFIYRTVEIRDGGYDTISTRIVINNALSQIPGFGGYCLSRKKNKTWLLILVKNSDVFNAIAWSGSAKLKVVQS